MQENDSEDDEDIEIKTPEQEVKEKVELAVEEETVIVEDEITIKEAVAEEAALVEEPLVEPESEVEEEKPEKSGNRFISDSYLVLAVPLHLCDLLCF